MNTPEAFDDEFADIPAPLAKRLRELKAQGVLTPEFLARFKQVAEQVAEEMRERLREHSRN